MYSCLVYVHVPCSTAPSSISRRALGFALLEFKLNTSLRPFKVISIYCARVKLEHMTTHMLQEAKGDLFPLVRPSR